VEDLNKPGGRKRVGGGTSDGEKVVPLGLSINRGCGERKKKGENLGGQKKTQTGSSWTEKEKKKTKGNTKNWPLGQSTMRAVIQKHQSRVTGERSYTVGGSGGKATLSCCTRLFI